MQQRIKVFIVDDHQIFIDGITALLYNTSNIEIVGCGLSGHDVVEGLKTIQIDVLLLDIGMADMNGVETAAFLTENYPQVKYIALTMYADQNKVTKMVKAGASGYLLKNTSKQELIDAIQTVHQGGTFYSKEIERFTTSQLIDENDSMISKLTKRELEIIKLITKSLTNKEIANMLFLSELTVNTHRKNAMQKLGLKNTASLVKFALDNDIH